MRIDEITQTSLLYDFYGQLLSRRQREVMELYHEENLTLSEIAEEFGITRQGVHDALKNAEKALHEYEEKLKLVARFEKSSAAVQEIDAIIDSVMERLQKGAVDRTAEAAAADRTDEFVVANETVDAADRTVEVAPQLILDLKKVKHIIDNLEE